MRVVTIGNFDGVHHGHRVLVGAALAQAADTPGSQVVVVTFQPHPLAVLRPDAAPALLTSMPRRSELLIEAGADEVVVLPFTKELSEMSPEGFAHLLRERPDIAADAVVVGENFRFGKGAAGNTATLASLGEALGFDVFVQPVVAEETAEQGSVTCSSTYVRRCIAEGDMQATAHALGRPHRLEGSVVRGDARGRELGYPTANVDVLDGMAIPPDGVYAGWLVTHTDRLPAAISIGTNPQFDGRERRVEAYALDRDDLELYAQHVGVDVVARLRGQAVFPSVADLQAQMARDVAAAREALAG